jgi:mannose-6-phosphate isomerase-like protein (cupin superfamily)
MTDITVAAFDDMQPMYEGLARRSRASLNVTAWGMQLFTLPPNWDGYPMHTHGPEDVDANQEEVYLTLEGGGTLHADDERVALKPGMMVRVGPTQPRRVLPGDEGIRFLVIGGRPGAFDAPEWTELNGPMPA